MISIKEQIQTVGTLRVPTLYRAAQRTRDIVLSVLALAVLWPLMIAIAAVIVIDCPGASPIFRQNRIGKDGRSFTFYKFRTMCPNAEQELERLLPYNEMDGPTFKLKNDPRITRFGRILRRSSMDELPQLWNVLRGDMSLVGPRPALPREVARYDDRARRRLAVTPGITGLWQIQPDRYCMSFEQLLELDLRYIRERSSRTDWKILLETLRTVLRMDGQ